MQDAAHYHQSVLCCGRTTVNRCTLAFHVPISAQLCMKEKLADSPHSRQPFVKKLIGSGVYFSLCHKSVQHKSIVPMSGCSSQSTFFVLLDQANAFTLLAALWLCAHSCRSVSRGLRSVCEQDVIYYLPGETLSIYLNYEIYHQMFVCLVLGLIV